MTFLDTYWFVLLIGSFAAFFFYRMAKFGGFKGAAFGARVTERSGTISRTSFMHTSEILRLYKLEGQPEKKAIGMEFSVTAQMGTKGYLALSREEAEKLKDILDRLL